MKKRTTQSRSPHHTSIGRNTPDNTPLSVPTSATEPTLTANANAARAAGFLQEPDKVMHPVLQAAVVEVLRANGNRIVLPPPL